MENNSAEFITREEALAKLQNLIGEDLRPLADKYGVTVFKNGKLNKGWGGVVVERYLGLTTNNNQAPNGKYFELKQVSLKTLNDGSLVPKETMWITMINEDDLKEREFERSHLFDKMKSMIVCAILYTSPGGTSIFERVVAFDILKGDVYNQIKADYDEVRNAILKNGFGALKSEMGVYIQPRTKGPGHGSISRAFYARTRFLKKIFAL